MALSADNIELKPHMLVFTIDNHGKIHEHIIKEIVSPYKILYTEPCSNGYIGARAKFVFVSRRLAARFSLEG